MLRAHAIRSLFDENVQDDCKGFILTTNNGMLQGSSSSLAESVAKRASALCGLIWRSHIDEKFHTTSASSIATHAVDAVAIRRGQDGNINSILFAVSEKDGHKSADASGVRIWAVAPVKERMLVAAAGSMLPSQEDLADTEKIILVNKAEGMADHLREELNGFVMPA